MNRRHFLKVILAACAAPAIVKAESIMRIATPKEMRIVGQAELTFDEFQRQLLHTIAENLDVPYSLMAGDYSVKMN